MGKAVQVKFKCESCGKNHTWRPQLANKKAKCSCGHVMRVPAGPTGLAVKQRRSSKDEDLGLDEEEIIESSAEHAARAPGRSSGRLWSRLAVYLAAFGFAALSAYLFYIDAHHLSWPLGSLLLAVILVCVGLWLRPQEVGGPLPSRM
jgi:hypothetical protein